MRVDEFKPNRFALHFGTQKVNVQVTTEIAAQMADAPNRQHRGSPHAGISRSCFVTDAEPEAVEAHLRSSASNHYRCCRPAGRARLDEVGLLPRSDGNLIEISTYLK
jgi:hypothetical protein